MRSAFVAPLFVVPTMNKERYIAQVFKKFLRLFLKFIEVCSSPKRF